MNIFTRDLTDVALVSEDKEGETNIRKMKMKMKMKIGPLTRRSRSNVSD